VDRFQRAVHQIIQYVYPPKSTNLPPTLEKPIAYEARSPLETVCSLSDVIKKSAFDLEKKCGLSDLLPCVFATTKKTFIVREVSIKQIIQDTSALKAVRISTTLLQRLYQTEEIRKSLETDLVKYRKAKDLLYTVNRYTYWLNRFRKKEDNELPYIENSRLPDELIAEIFKYALQDDSDSITLKEYIHSTLGASFEAYNLGDSNRSESIFYSLSKQFSDTKALADHFFIERLFAYQSGLTTESALMVKNFFTNANQFADTKKKIACLGNFFTESNKIRRIFSGQLVESVKLFDLQANYLISLDVQLKGEATKQPGFKKGAFPLLEEARIVCKNYSHILNTLPQAVCELKKLSLSTDKVFVKQFKIMKSLQISSLEKLKLSTLSLGKNALSELSAYAPKVRNLYLDSISEVDSCEKGILPKLAHLHLKKVKLDSVPPPGFLRGIDLQSLHHLEIDSFDLSEVLLPPESFSIPSSVSKFHVAVLTLKTCQDLSFFNFDSLLEYTLEAVQGSIIALPKMVNVEKISIGSQQTEQKLQGQLSLKCLEKYQKLKELEISGELVSSSDNGGKLENVEELVLHRSWTEDYVFSALTLPKLKRLEVHFPVDLESQWTTEGSHQHYPLEGNALPVLEEVVFKNCYGKEAMLANLKGLSAGSVKQVDLSSCIGDKPSLDELTVIFPKLEQVIYIA